MPYFGISKVSSATAVTSPLSDFQNDVLKVLLRLRIDIAVSGGIDCPPSTVADWDRENENQREPFFPLGFLASYRRFSNLEPSQGHKKMSIYGKSLEVLPKLQKDEITTYDAGYNQR